MMNFFKKKPTESAAAPAPAAPAPAPAPAPAGAPSEAAPPGHATPSAAELALLQSDDWDEEIKEQVAELREPVDEQGERIQTKGVELSANYTLDEMLRALVSEGGSDLHLSVGSPPAIRLHGELIFCEAPALTAEMAENMLLPLISADKVKHYQETGHQDFAHEIPQVARFRGNFFRQHHGMAAVFRTIPSKIPTLEELNLPPVLKKIALERSGLVLVTGPTGSGKSTTLAAMINLINATRQAHLITIEDPIEFFHKSNQCLIDHREVGEHAISFSDGLRASLREDPDIILVGEMRDLDTIYNAIKAAETGCLVFGTLHTNSAAKTIDRVIDVFPGKQQPQIRTMLSESLKAVVAQLLMRKLGGGGRVAVHEILISRSGFPALVREGKTSQINNFIMTNRDEGMQTMDQALVEHLKAKRISLDSAKELMHDPNYFKSQGFPVEIPD